MSSETNDVLPTSIVSNVNDIESATYTTAWEDPDKRRHMLNEDVENIQNESGFPYKIDDAKGLKPARYDYQIIIDDDRYSKNMKKSLEDQLQEARASLGIPVHGRTDLARAMKYYMYNRFQVPDPNLAYSKTFTYVFFSRPDLNLLATDGTNMVPNMYVKSDDEALMTYKRHPDLFKLLTDYSRCGDSNNFNMLLSNQCKGISVEDTTLSTVDAGKNWSNYEMSYGDEFTGHAGGTVTVSFEDTSDYSVMSLLRLWMLYIHNVRKGYWSPAYDLYGDDPTKVSTSSPRDSYVHNKVLDYASSIYVIKCGPDGSDVLYWIKYFGTIPTSTGESALSWDSSSPFGDRPKIQIPFKYAYKRVNKGLSLLEFNRLSGIMSAKESAFQFAQAWNPNYNHADRPFVGAPFIHIDLKDPSTPKREGTAHGASNKNSVIRLLFRPANLPNIEEKDLFRGTPLRSGPIERKG